MTNKNSQPLTFGRVAPMLPVSDIERAVGFYCQTLGFQKRFENGNPVGFVILVRDDAELHLTLQPEHPSAKFNVAHMMVSDADEVYRLCQQAGCRIIKKLRTHDFGMRMFVFEDPDGNRIDVGAEV
ncbi:MAG: VOC family protein [Pseudomonadota bacterium]